MARCRAVTPNGQCNNHTLPNHNMCQTHAAMKTTPHMVDPKDYAATSPTNRASQMGKVVGVNSGHRRLIGKARKKYEAGDMRSAAELAEEFGGDRNWWAKIVVYAQAAPKFLQVNSANQLKRYVNEVMPEVVEMPSPPTMGIVGETPDRHSTTMRPPVEDRPKSIEEWEALGTPPKEGPSLKELNDLWLQSKEPDLAPEPTEDVHQDILDRLWNLETYMSQVFRHLMEN